MRQREQSSADLCRLGSLCSLCLITRRLAIRSNVCHREPGEAISNCQDEDIASPFRPFVLA